jgi:hypothetical protein
MNQTVFDVHSFPKIVVCHFHGGGGGGKNKILLSWPHNTKDFFGQ